MPEEINRIVTDAISDLFFVSEPAGAENLLREGHAASRIHLVGNVMIDTLYSVLGRVRSTDLLTGYGVSPHAYGVVTMHRPSNVDDVATLEPLLRVLAHVSRELPLFFPIHPRTASRLEQFRLRRMLDDAPGIISTPPLGYLEFLALTSQARVIVTDSGGLQEESTALGVPCLTLRLNTERPVTVETGTSTLVGNDAQKLQHYLCQVLDGSYKQGRCPELWDGRAAERIAATLVGESVRAT
jgi:UDP-N-acetylglucosamine 2-epimerase (non-hydrolysing)